jgi:hypothetical protein
MSVHTFLRGTSSDEDEPGKWYRVGASALIICPRCCHGWGRVLLELGQPDGAWTIDADGNITPSVHCHFRPRSKGIPLGAECGFHEFIRLDGWTVRDETVTSGE